MMTSCGILFFMETTMNFIKSFYVTHFSKPACDRVIFKCIQTEHPRKILEIGIQRGTRTANLLQMVLRYCGEPSEVSYTAIDPFEGRSSEDGPGLSLRKAHRLISQFGVKSRLDPQPPEIAVKQFFLNRLIEKVDLAIITTPRFEWFTTCATHLSELIHESAGIFVGFPSQIPTEPFIFEKFTFPEFEQVLHDPAQLNRLCKKAG